jgi:hypothetical protein
MEGETRNVELRVHTAEEKTQELQGLILVAFDEVEAPKAPAGSGQS